MFQPEYPGAIGMFVDESRVFIDQNSHFAIVLHKTACGAPCTAQDVANFFATDPNKASTHFVVGQDGTVVQCVLLKDGAGGNCCVEPGYDSFWSSIVNAGTNLNTVTISIEHCDPTTDNSTDLTEQQKTASFNLVSWLCQRYNIPSSHIKTHASIDPQSRARCPGNYPLSDLIAFVGDNMNVPSGWHTTTVNGDPRLVAPNGGVARGGFMQFILGEPVWDPEDMPELGEEVVSVLEESNPARGGGIRQQYTFSILEMVANQNNIIQRGWTGQELIFVRKDRDNLRSQVTQLQSKITQLQSGLPKADIQATIADLNKLSGELSSMVT